MPGLEPEQTAPLRNAGSPAPASLAGVGEASHRVATSGPAPAPPDGSSPIDAPPGLAPTPAPTRVYKVYRANKSPAKPACYALTPPRTESAIELKETGIQTELKFGISIDRGIWETRIVKEEEKIIGEDTKIKFAMKA